jgi:hypothetical protein
MKARHLRRFMCASSAACALIVSSRAGAAESVFERFAGLVADSNGYAVRMETHEELGDRSDDAVYWYVRKANGERAARILEGRGAGLTISNAGLASRARSLRGNDLRGIDLALLADCMRAHREAVTLRPGPQFDGAATVALVFARSAFVCVGDAPLDRTLTADIIDVRENGTPVLRKRYADHEVVERIRFRDFTLPTSF